MKLLIVKLACKVLTSNADFCKEIGLFGTLGVGNDDPVYKMEKKEEFDKWLDSKGIDPTKYWKKFDEYIQSDACKEEYKFIYDPSKPAWEQVW